MFRGIGYPPRKFGPLFSRGRRKCPLSALLWQNSCLSFQQIVFQQIVFQQIVFQQIVFPTNTFFTSLVAEDGDHLLEGYLYKLGGTLMSNWPRKYFHLFPNRLEWRGEQAGVCFLFSMKVSGGHADCCFRESLISPTSLLKAYRSLHTSLQDNDKLFRCY